MDATPHRADDPGLSLDQLNRAFAAMLGGGDDPYSKPDEADGDPVHSALEAAESESAVAVEQPTADDACEVTPRSILEAMLMVGLPDNAPLAATQIAGLMRGVRPAEIEELVRDLNEMYRRQNRPYTIASQGAGFRLTLRDDFTSVRERFAGKVKEAKLSPAAIEVLAIVAYNEPVSAAGVTEMRGASATAILAQLVRRQLLCMERSDEKPPVARYRTTPRFLKEFGIRSLAEMPRSVELDRQ